MESLRLRKRSLWGVELGMAAEIMARRTRYEAVLRCVGLSEPIDVVRIRSR